MRSNTRAFRSSFDSQRPRHRVQPHIRYHASSNISGPEGDLQDSSLNSVSLWPKFCESKTVMFFHSTFERPLLPCHSKNLTIDVPKLDDHQLSKQPRQD
jgi:hypothetical protein